MPVAAMLRSPGRQMGSWASTSMRDQEISDDLGGAYVPGPQIPAKLCMAVEERPARVCWVSCRLAEDPPSPLSPGTTPHTPPESKWECLARQLTEPSFLGGPGLYGYPRTSPCSEAGLTEPAAHTISRHLLPLGTPNRVESHIQP